MMRVAATPSRARSVGLLLALCAGVAVPAAAESGDPALVAPVAPVVQGSGSARATEASRPVLTDSRWRSVVDFYRATAGLAPLKVSKAWGKGGKLHGRYMVQNRVITHDEQPSKPYYTRAGALAGRNGNVTLTRRSSGWFPDRALVEGWMVAPFHAAGIVDPRLRTTGYGTYRATKAGVRMQGATLDVLRGRTGSAPDEVVVWPGDGMQVPLTAYDGNEWPDPLTSCAGYGDRSGLPILALFPDDVRVASSTFRDGSADLAHCTFDAHTYRNPKRADRLHARAVLASRNTVVLVPKRALEDFHAYTATITTTDGQTITWTFTVGEVEPPVDPQITGAVVSRPFQERSSFGVAWTATDEGSGVASYDVRWRRGAPDGTLSPMTMWKQGIAASSAQFQGDPGYTYCFSARATDRAGNRSGWSPERCTTVPIRSIDLVADPVWAPLAGDFYEGSASASLLPDSTLSTGRVTARRIALIASRGPDMGAVEVLWNGKRLAVVDLEHADLRSRLQIDVAAFPRMRTGRVTVRVITPDRHVIVEGLGVGRR